MWSILKSIIWIVGAIVVVAFVLNYFGYEINKEYFKESRSACEQKLKECQSQLIHKGTDGAECSFNCVNPKLIIKKK
jgi:hypothetical protein